MVLRGRPGAAGSPNSTRSGWLELHSLGLSVEQHRLEVGELRNQD